MRSLLTSSAHNRVTALSTLLHHTTSLTRAKALLSQPQSTVKQKVSHFPNVMRCSGNMTIQHYRGTRCSLGNYFVLRSEQERESKLRRLYVTQFGDFSILVWGAFNDFIFILDFLHSWEKSVFMKYLFLIIPLLPFVESARERSERNKKAFSYSLEQFISSFASNACPFHLSIYSGFYFALLFLSITTTPDSARLNPVNETV